jgi:hypothetical protein
MKWKEVTLPLNRALKLKNRMVQRLGAARDNVRVWNSYKDGTEPPYDVSAELDRATDLATGLGNLKAAISEANLPVIGDIHRMVEAKQEIAFLQRVSTQEGRVREHYSQEHEDTYLCTIKRSDLDGIVRELEDELDTIQEKLDKHNAKTKIKVTLPYEE